VCSGEHRALDLTVFTRGADDHVQDGILRCSRCSSWFPIQDAVLELVDPALIDRDALRTFTTRFASQLAAAAAASPQAASLDEQLPQLKQRRHFDWFASESDQSYDEYQRSLFWRAADAAAFKRWVGRVAPGAWVLDVGCANGRSAWPLAATGATIVGCDISRRLIVQAIEHARRRGIQGRTTFLVADADRLPFATEAFDFVLTYGALHHLPNPGRTSRDIQRVVKVGGVHFGSENNKSAFRKLFDLLMRLKPLWIEEAGEEPLISASMLREWLAGLPTNVHVATHIFVPPHLINMLPSRFGAGVLNVTDAIGSRVPLVRDNGGLILFEARKMASHAAG
jgi:2-polyprenyl-3-methyl-5-hydroxy-6-metoxy-1,4-benzoquinol methylase